MNMFVDITLLVEYFQNVVISQYKHIMFYLQQAGKQGNYVSKQIINHSNLVFDKRRKLLRFSFFFFLGLVAYCSGETSMFQVEILTNYFVKYTKCLQLISCKSQNFFLFFLFTCWIYVTRVKSIVLLDIYNTCEINCVYYLY